MKLLRCLPALLLALLLLSCGGGSGSLVASPGDGGGVGTGGTGVVAGTVTGLGSVVIDGTRYDDSQAALESQPDLANNTPLALADLHIGQYAYLALDASGQPTVVRIASQLVGPAAAVNAAAGRITVWGQQVAINSDPASGPVTVFSGYGSLADMQPGDPVQVYAVLQSASGGADLLRATRIERLDAAGALPARLTGTLQAGSGSTLLLAGRPLDVSAVVNPPALAAGAVVTAIVPWSSTLPASWKASAIALLAPGAASSVRLSGAAHLLPGGFALVQGVQVNLSALPQSQRGAVQEGSYLTVDGQSLGKDGAQLLASSVQALPQAGRDAQLRGSITSVAGTASFVVRGQAVDAGGAEFRNGSAANLVPGAYVEVDGVQAADTVLALRVTFSATTPQHAVLEVQGTVQSVDSAQRQLALLAEDGRTLTLVVPAGVTLPAAGDSMAASGYWDGSALQVRDLEIENSGKGGGR
jgi:hypothetical protein